MREIKFRQPIIENNVFQRWHYWGFIDGSFVGPHSNWRINESYQYTGLKDKNGKEIYEDDITESGWTILYRGGMFVPFYDYGRAEMYEDAGTNWWSDCEIIGNRYENPDLWH